MKLKATCNSKASSQVAGQGAFLNYITRRILTEVPPNSLAYVIDFFEARRQLLTESEGTALNSGADRKVQEPASRRERSLDLGEAFELGGYWVIWAAVVTGWPLGCSVLKTTPWRYSQENRYAPFMNIDSRIKENALWLERWFTE